MKNLKLTAVLILALSMINISCSGGSGRKAEPSGGSCSYNKFEGYAKIKSIKPAPKSEYNCPDQPMQITFEFTPVNQSDRQKYKFTNFKDSVVHMKINDGANPSMSWIKKNKIEAGKKYKCIRTEITKGTCTPVGFEFPELNLMPETGCN